MSKYPTFRTVSASLLLVLCLLVKPGLVTAQAVEDDLMNAPIPIVYGEEGFRQRIEARTGGEREAVGLVLSGGSARAFAHIGVLTRLEEAGIVPDFIVANSMGSIIGLLYAAGLSPAQIHYLVSSTDIAALFAPVLPLKGGILDVSRFSGLLRSYLGDLRLEDLPIPVLICTEDLITKREVRLAEGDLYTVMEAAYALPVYFPPVPYGDHLLIDGGITNLVPLAVAYEYARLAIVSSTFYDARNLNLRNPLIILNTAIDIGKRRAGVSDLAAYPEAVWIRCDVESFSFMAFDSMEVLAAVGYQSADAMAEALAALPASGMDPALEAIRAGFALEAPGVLLDWSRYERTNAHRPVAGVSLGLDSFAYPGDRWLLRDTLGLGAALGLRSGTLEGALTAGVQWDAYGDGGVVPAAWLDLAAYPVPALGLFSQTDVTWQDDSPSWYLRNGFQLALPRDRRPGESGLTRLDLRSFLEQKLDQDFGLESALLTTSVELGRQGLLGNWFVSIEAGHQLAGGWTVGGQASGTSLADGEYRHFGFAALSAGIPLASELSLRGRALVRGGLSADALAPLFLADPFGAIDVAAYSGLSRVLAAGSLALRWAPGGFRPSFAETIIMKDNALSLYTDILWRSGPETNVPVVAGIRLETNLSLIGLQANRMQIELGYDLDAGAPVFRAFLF
jgi:NTE family protein